MAGALCGRSGVFFGLVLPRLGMGHAEALTAVAFNVYNGPVMSRKAEPVPCPYQCGESPKKRDLLAHLILCSNAPKKKAKRKK